MSDQVLPCDRSSISCDDGASQTVDESQLDLTLCHQNPKLIIAESELSPTDVSSPVFYLEKNDIPGVCVDRGDCSFSWSPVKFSRSAVKIGVRSTESSDVDIDDCLSIDYQPRNGVPGFEVETKADSFWSPVAHRTRSNKKLNRELT